jgi:hypothetical protein
MGRDELLKKEFMKNYIAHNGQVWGFPDDYDGPYITPEMRPILDAELATLRAPSLADLKEQALAQVRSQRAPIINVLDGMQSSANFKGETAKAAALETAKQSLKDLTKIDLSACVTADDFKAKIMQRYREVAAALPADLRIAFAEALQ